MSTIPTITKNDIRTFVGEQNFLKGQQHVRDEAIVNPEQQAMALKAYCYGSLPEPYRAQVTFDGTGITAAFCSCSASTPSDGTRGCEHAAALLLAWNEQPKTFTEVERLITERGRSNYQVACRYLATMRSLYEKLDETGQWTTYIAWLRKRHSRLSTLKQELVAAGL